MKSLAKYWKLVIALILVGAALWIYFQKYQTEKAAYEAESQQLQNIISILETQLANNLKYKDIQDELDDAKAELEESRVELYQHFPEELKEEDQILYALYLETVFDTEIKLWDSYTIDGNLGQMGIVPKQQQSLGAGDYMQDSEGNKLGPVPGAERKPGTNFHFGTPQVLTTLQDPDQASLLGLLVVVNYESTYEGFKDMIDYLASDSRITSIYEGTISYNAKKDLAKGTLYLVLYMLDSDRDYVAPDIKQFITDKENIYK